MYLSLNVYVTCGKSTLGHDNQFKIQYTVSLHFWQFKLNWALACVCLPLADKIVKGLPASLQEHHE